MRRRSAVIVLMVISTGCMHKAKPEAQPPHAAAAPEAAKPEASKPETSKPEASKAAPTPNDKTPESTSSTKPAPNTAKPAPSTAKPAPSPAKPSTTKNAPAPAKGQTPQPAGTSAGNKPQPATPSQRTAAPTLDLEALKTELKQTKAIGLMTKLSLKNQVDDLLDEFRKHHAGKPTPTLAELRHSYDLLMMKVLSLLQDRDRKLASEIVSSREQIWGLLADPKKFAALQA
jgi:hypothetical protein